MLRILLVCIRTNLKSVLKYKFLILSTDHPETLYLREQGCEDSLIYFEAKRGPRAHKLGIHRSKELPLGYLRSLEHGCVEDKVRVTLCQIATPLGDYRQHDADLHTLQSHRDLTIPRRRPLPKMLWLMCWQSHRTDQVMVRGHRCDNNATFFPLSYVTHTQGARDHDGTVGL